MQLRQAEAALEAKQWDEALRVVNAALAADPKNAAALLMQGHVAAAQRAPSKEAMDLYRRALALDPGLRDDRRLIQNLVAALGQVNQLPAELLRQYPSKPAVEALKQRTLQQGYHGRGLAVQVLGAIGRGSEVDAVPVAILDLKEGDSCAQRHDAVRRLDRAGDRRALAPLREILSDGLIGSLRNACLRSDAKAAVAKLEKK